MGKLALCSSFATGLPISRAISAKRSITNPPKFLGGGTCYLSALRDRDGELFDRTATCRLRVPKDTPAKDSWSMTVYNSASRSMMATAQKFPAASSYTNVETNPDGTIVLYFGPKAPAGKERNWIETDPAKGWTGIFRLYGPLEPFFDQSCRLPDIERVDWLRKTPSFLAAS